MLMTITKQDVKKADRGDPRMCPVVMAIRRITKAKVVEVDEGRIAINGKTCRMPAKCQRFVRAWDTGLEYTLPVEFNLPDWMLGSKGR